MKSQNQRPLESIRLVFKAMPKNLHIPLKSEHLLDMLTFYVPNNQTLIATSCYGFCITMMY